MERARVASEREKCAYQRRRLSDRPLPCGILVTWVRKCTERKTRKRGPEQGTERQKPGVEL